MTIDQPLAQRGKAALNGWSGVVSIERPDALLTKLSPEQAACRVLSARTLEYNGRRAVLCSVPYSMVRQFFMAEDEDLIYHEATVTGGTDNAKIQFHGRSNFRGWAYHSGIFN